MRLRAIVAFSNYIQIRGHDLVVIVHLYSGLEAYGYKTRVTILAVREKVRMIGEYFSTRFAHFKSHIYVLARTLNSQVYCREQGEI